MGGEGAVAPTPIPNHTPHPAPQEAQSEDAVLLTQGGTKPDLDHDNVTAAWAENHQKMIYTTFGKCTLLLNNSLMFFFFPLQDQHGLLVTKRVKLLITCKVINVSPTPSQGDLPS